MSMATDFLQNMGNHYEATLEDVTKSASGRWVNSFEIIDELRWSNIYAQVFRFTDDSYLEFIWEQGKTECQDDHPNNVRAYLVEPQEVTVVKYVHVE